ncbi:NAD-dependent alcohol dehydrogenase [Sulfuracidifex tepidarius]|uniref:NAD-dependent alcohol dehydrogenase n=1 Tax=Sulfuracidifex tepidarius TaxID=1294262 RepID=A0A510DSQ0_9CREN|nr:alcohol dehydrogenase catalytic domain-containing protein [Sulfuracidifex tepidarius]BBG23212.1 NAD-dependent alcohol dehydrogenase [Sulfuracidifex tepidarius]
MKALVFQKSGIENLRYTYYDDPQLGKHEVLVKVRMAGVDPVDLMTVNSLKVKPIPHIPGTEFAGEVEKVGDQVRDFTPGDKVTVYGKIYDGTCDMCMAGYETVCRNGGRVGIDTNGGYAEYVAIDEKYVHKLPEGYGWELASSLSISALTAYHALKEAALKPGQTLVVFGASGNTGMFLVQLGKKFGAKVIAVTTKSWLGEMGADLSVSYDEVEEKVGEFTHGRMGDVVVNSLGKAFWEKGMKVVGVRGKVVTFGTLLGSEATVNLYQLYSKHVSIMGVNRGNRSDFVELLDLCKDCKVKVWKKFPLEEGVSALRSIGSGERDGRVMIEVE